MAQNFDQSMSTNLDGLGYAYDKVVFQPEKPVLASELNTSQELQEILTQKSTAHLPSGWLSYRPIYTSSDLDNAFYTQDPDGAIAAESLVRSPQQRAPGAWRSPPTHPRKLKSGRTLLTFANLTKSSRNRSRQASPSRTAQAEASQSASMGLMRCFSRTSPTPRSSPPTTSSSRRSLVRGFG